MEDMHYSHHARLDTPSRASTTQWLKSVALLSDTRRSPGAAEALAFGVRGPTGTLRIARFYVS